MPDPNIITSGLSERITVEGHLLSIEIYKLEGELNWSLEVVDEDGTSTVWEELFKTDQFAKNEVLKTINEEGLSGFRDSGNVISFPKK